MSSLILQKISSENGHLEIDRFLKSISFLPTFYFSPYTLNTWLNTSGKDLYIATYGNEKSLILYRLFNVKIPGVRFLFSEPSERFIAEVQEHFKARFIAANELYNSQSTEITTELLLNIKELLSLSDKKIRKDYTSCVRNYPNLRCEPYTPELKAEVFEFLEKWNTTRSDELNKFALTEKDKHFLDLYSTDAAIHGCIVKDEHSIVGISFFIPSLDGKAIGVISKCLRGYTQLGLYTFIERAKMMDNLGYLEVYIGSINNDFKKRFISQSKLIEVGAKVLYKEPGLEFKSPSRYLQFLF